MVEVRRLGGIRETEPGGRLEEELLRTLQTGVASKEGQENGYQGRLRTLEAVPLLRYRAGAGENRTLHLEKEDKRRRTAREKGKGGECRSSQGARCPEIPADSRRAGQLGFQPGGKCAAGTILSSDIRNLRQEAAMR